MDPSLNNNGGIIREKMRVYLRENAALCTEAVDDIERGIFNWSLEYASVHGIVRKWSNSRFRAIYRSKARSVTANMVGNGYVGNTRLKNRLEEREFPPQALAYMRPENMYPEVWKQVLDTKLKRDQFFEKPEAMTDQFRCGRCKKRECVYQELQLRSSDEPMSLFITCLNCGHRWRLG